MLSCGPYGITNVLKSMYLISKLGRSQSLRILEIEEACLNSNEGYENVEIVLNLISKDIPFDTAVLSFVGSRRWSQKSFHIGFGTGKYLSLCREQFQQSLAYRLLHCSNSYDVFCYEDSETNLGQRHGQILSVFLDLGFRQAMHDSTLNCFISFCSLSTRFEDRHSCILKLIVPHISTLLNNLGNKEDKNNESSIHLTDAEFEVLRWCCEGKTSWEIGVITSRSERTVKFHLANIYKKLEVTCRSQAVVRAIKLGLVELI